MKDYQRTESFLFFLLLEDKLPRVFFNLQKHFKRKGLDLIPIKMDQFQLISSATSQAHLMILISITNTQERFLYQHKLRKFLKFFLKSKRLSLMIMSSFLNLNDTASFSHDPNYLFLNYPVQVNFFCEKVIGYLNKQEDLIWPGAGGILDHKILE